MTKLAALLLAIGAAPRARAQEPLLWIVRADRDAIVERIREIEAAQERGDWRYVVTTTQALLDTLVTGVDLDAKERSPAREVVVVPDAAEPESLHAAVEYLNRRIAQWPAAAKELYRTLFDERGRKAAAAAAAETRFVATLDIRQRYRATSAGMDYLARGGRLALERGDAAGAVQAFADLHSTDAVRGAALAAEFVIALEAAERGGAALAGERFGLPALATTTAPTGVGGWSEAIESLSRSGARSAFDGGAARSAGGSRPDGPLGPLRVQWSVPFAAILEDRRKTSLRPEPLVGNGRVFAHHRSAALAVDIETGSVVWRRDFVDQKDAGKDDVARATAREPGLFRGALGAGLYAFTVRSSAGRVVVALDQGTGAVRWKVEPLAAALLDGPGAEGTLIFDDAPLIADDAVFVTAHDDTATPRSYLTAFDAGTGALRFVVRIGSGLPMAFASEGATALGGGGSAPAAFAEGLVFVCDNLGTIAAIEAASGAPRWLYRYPRRGGADAETAGSLGRGWDANPVVVSRGRVAVAPDDADSLFVLAVRPPAAAPETRGRRDYILHASLPRRGFTQMIDFDGGAAVLSGRDGDSDAAIVHMLAPGDERRIHRWISSAPLDTLPRFRGAISENAVYVASKRYVYRIDRTGGAVGDPLLAREADPPRGLGPLVAANGGLVIATADGLEFLVPSP